MIDLVQVFVIQEMSSGRFLSRNCGLVKSLTGAGRMHDAQEALDTAVCQFGGEFQIHSFYEAKES